MLEIFKSGGPLMYVILLLSVLGLAVIVDRFIYFFTKERGNTEDIKFELEKAIKTDNKKEALDLCELYSNSSSKVLRELIAEVNFEEEVKVEVLEEKAREVALSMLPKLEKHMWLLGVAANVTPLVGLLGTVSGMILAFKDIATVGTGNPEVLAVGISQALITTAAGLTVAIPSVIFYNYFNKKIDNIINDIEKSSVEVINILRKR